MTITKTAGLLAAAALAIPAAAVAHDGSPGKPGPKPPHVKHAKKQPQCTKLAAFKIAGANLNASALTIADGKADGTLVLDVRKANGPARAFLGITSLPAAGQKLTLTADALHLRLDDVNGLADVKPTDVAKIDGRVTKTHKGCPATTPTLDVTKLTVTRR